MTNKDVQAIVQISIDPRFEIKNFLNELRNEWTILKKMNAFIKFTTTYLFYSFNFFEKYPKLSLISSCVCPTTRNPN